MNAFSLLEKSAGIFFQVSFTPPTRDSLFVMKYRDKFVLCYSFIDDVSILAI